MTEPTKRISEANAAPGPDEAGDSTAPRKLGMWMLAWVLIQFMSWWAGIPQARLDRAIEQGAAEVERRSVGEVGEEDIREAIALQRDTLPFFRALAIVRDFLLGPISLAARALAAAVLFAGMAALVGRPGSFGKALEVASAVQGFWVAGLALQTALVILLGRAEVETSATLLLDGPSQPAVVWVALRQLDLFALLGWLNLARGSWREGQASVAGAVLGVVLLASAEALVRIGSEIVLGGWMRLSLLPETLG